MINKKLVSQKEVKAPISLTRIAKQGISKPLNLFSSHDEVEMDEINFVNLGHAYSKKVEGDQIQYFSLGTQKAGDFVEHQTQGLGIGIQEAEYVKENQYQILGIGVQKVGHSEQNQDQFLSVGVQKAGSVGKNQTQGLGIGFQKAGHVGGDQCQGLGIGFQKARYVGGDQFSILPLGIVSKAERVKGIQGGNINIQTKERLPRQKGIFNHNRTEGWTIGTSTGYRLEKAKKLINGYDNPHNLKMIAELDYSWIHNKTGYWTTNDLAIREAKKRAARKKASKLENKAQNDSQ